MNYSRRQEKSIAAAEKAWIKRTNQLRKLAKGAAISFVDGWACLTYPNGQIFKCRGTGPAEVFGMENDG